MQELLDLATSTKVLAEMRKPRPESWLRFTWQDTPRLTKNPADLLDLSMVVFPEAHLRFSRRQLRCAAEKSADPVPELEFEWRSLPDFNQFGENQRSSTSTSKAPTPSHLELPEQVHGAQLQLPVSFVITFLLQKGEDVKIL